ncbi:MAG TPA: glycine zipper 2TM domain-containing protein [Burkholderiales bacterium]|nr:glycine zipper 2TM domain-containing protein [Burkholderiales bacterium]
MEAINKSRLHPLLTIAAISVTVLSAVGVGAMTGLLPHSGGTTKDAEPVVAAVPEQPQPSAIEPSMPAAAAVATPVAKPKPVHRVAKPRPTQPMQVAEAAPVAQASQPVEAPKPVVPAGITGIVESVKEITTPGDGRSGVGAIGGGVVGAILGNQFGNGTGKKVMTVLGAAGGALAGKEIEKQANAKKHWEVTVRLDDGSYQTLSSPAQPYWHAGDRVRFLDGKLQPV